MSMYTRFMGDTDNAPGHRLVANPDLEEALNFQVLFPEPFRLNESDLTKAIRQHPYTTDTARVEIEHTTVSMGTPLGLAGWGDHVIQLMGFNIPMPPDILSHSLQVSHCDQELKALAYNHRSYLNLSYAGYVTDPFSQYEALSILAGIFAGMGAIMVVNLRATSCVPAHMFSPAQLSAVQLEQVFQDFLPASLYRGFVKYFVPDEVSGWVRTVGADALYLPDLAAFLPDMAQAEEYFIIFANIHTYLRNENVILGVGHTLQVGPDHHVKLRIPTEDEFFLHSEGVMYVLGPGSEFESRRVAKFGSKRP